VRSAHGAIAPFSFEDGHDAMRRLKILTWHTHGTYLYYLTQAPHDFYVMSKPDRPPGYAGRWGHLPWGDNVFDMPVDHVREQRFDCILFQDDDQYFNDQHRYLSEEQRRLPKIYLEHDTPREHPTDMPHPVDDPNVLLVHVTHFNALMWDNRRTPYRVIEHGVMVPENVSYDGSRARGLVVVNHLARRGRRLGGDVYLRVRKKVLLDLAGMGAEEMPGGVGEVLHHDLPAFSAQYRFLFNPIRYTSLGLAVIEAMMIGVPVVALATTEMATVIEHGVSGYVDTDVDKLVACMRLLLEDRELARMLGAEGQRRAKWRFHIDRFVQDWDRVLREVTE
jgi:glycosyltransferase involved in cell wall biosynthesis